MTSQIELVEYYYFWKKTHAGLSSRNTRRQRKQTHIRLCRMMMKQREPTPEREFSEFEVQSLREREREREREGEREGGREGEGEGKGEGFIRVEWYNGVSN